MLWVRSYFAYDALTFTRSAGNDTDYQSARILSERGSIAYLWERHLYSESGDAHAMDEWRVRSDAGAAGTSIKQSYLQRPLRQGEGVRLGAWGFGLANERAPGYAVVQPRLRDLVRNRSYVRQSEFGLLMAPHWALIMLAGLPLELRLLSAARRRMREQRGHCPTCNYDLRESADVCPECGTKKPNRKQKRGQKQKKGANKKGGIRGITNKQ